MTNLDFHPTCMKFPIVPHLHQDLMLFAFFILANSEGCVVVSHGCFNLHIPDGWQVWEALNMFIGFLNSHFLKGLFHPIFLSGCLHFFILTYRSSSYIQSFIGHMLYFFQLSNWLHHFFSGVHWGIEVRHICIFDFGIIYISPVTVPSICDHWKAHISVIVFIKCIIVVLNKLPPVYLFMYLNHHTQNMNCTTASLSSS